MKESSNRWILDLRVFKKVSSEMIIKSNYILFLLCFCVRMEKSFFL